MPAETRAARARRYPYLAEFERQVDELALEMSRGRFITAAGIMVLQGCSKKSAYHRIRALAARGHVLQTARMREGTKGPPAVGYALVKKARP